MSSNLNFKNPKLFKFKFGREPKERNIENLQELYTKSKERYEHRRKELVSVTNEITKKISPIKKDIYHIFYKKSGKVHLVEIGWSTEYKCYTYSTRTTNLDNRAERLQYSLSDESSFYLGEKLRYCRKASESAHRHMSFIKSILNELIENKLREILNDKYKNTHKSRTFIVDIGTKKYFVYMINNGYGYNKFNIQDEFSEDSIIKI